MKYNYQIVQKLKESNFYIIFAILLQRAYFCKLNKKSQMKQAKSQKLSRISNVEKNFMYECQICYEEYDTNKHRPMIVCQNYHALCSTCVNQNLFKKQYNAHKNPTGRYMCSKCSKIIKKQNITEHKILNQVCQHIKKIKQKDQQMRRQFYNYVGTMGMSLVAMRSDYDIIQKNNSILIRQNELLIKQNSILKQNFDKIQRVKGSLQQLEKVSKQVEQLNENIQLQNATLQSLKQEVERKNQEIKKKNNEVLQQHKKYFQIQTQRNNLKQQIRMTARRNKQLLEQNQGAINLKQYLQQQINNLKNQKKYLAQENARKKQKMNQSIKLMQQYWSRILENDTLQNDQPKNESKSKLNKQKSLQSIHQNSFLSKQNSLLNKKQSLKNKQIQTYKPNFGIVQQCKKSQQQIKLNFQVDYQQKSAKNFYVQDNIITLNNDRLSSFTSISFKDGFKLDTIHQFTVKIRRLRSQSIMIGFINTNCKNKKNIYNRKGFFAIDGFNKYWSEGGGQQIKLSIKQGDQIRMILNPQIMSVSWTKNNTKSIQSRKIPIQYKTQFLYPVILLMQNKDSIEILDVK